MSKNIEAQIEEILSRGVAEVIESDSLRKALSSGKELRVKFGIDPTSPNIHLGRAVSLLKLRDFQMAGHRIVFIVGDFTGVIGDTSDKDSERPMLTRDQVRENMQTYIDQASKLLDMSKVEVRHNSEWLEKLGYNEIGEQANQFSIAEFISRDNIKKRLDEGKRVSLREVLYPLMQGYDSVVVQADIEVGGIDQRFNILAGRKLQQHFKQAPQNILLTNLILGTDGRKMSSSWGNTINLSDSAQDMFGKIMSVPDELIVEYFVHCTRVPMEEVDALEIKLQDMTINPRDAKIRLAKEVTTIYHGERAAAEAEQYFIDTFSKKKIPDDIRDIFVTDGEHLAQVLADHNLAQSKTDARRKIEQGGVELAGEKITDIAYVLTKSSDDAILKVGKKDFVRVKFEKQ